MRAKLYTLANGMQVVLEENHAAAVLSFNVLVKVGSADETEPQAGISHVIEHMLFKGTTHRKVGEIARDVEAAGGEINAYTSFDQTVYYINMARRFADKGLEILADAVQNPTFDAAELAREKEVILEEIRRERDNPGRYVGEILFQKAYLRHTYGRPIIGFEKTVKSFSQQNLFDFFHRWYTPQNSAIIVVGDFNGEEMLEKVKAAFLWPGDRRPETGDQTARTPEPPHLKPHIEIRPDNIQSIYFALGFNVPEITHADVPALDILTHTLGGAESSRLEQILKEKKRLVQSIYSYAYTPKDPGLLMIGGHLNVSQAERAFVTLWEETERLKKDGPTPEELRRAKLNIRANEIYEKETVGGQAGKLAYFLATTGRLDFEEQYYQRIQAVSAEEVAHAAQRYLLHTNMTAAMLVPKDDYGKPWSSRVLQTLEYPAAPQKAAAKKAGPLAKGGPRLHTLPNGVRLILKEDHTLPIVSVCSASLGGLLSEGPADNGICHVMAHCLTKGTKKRNALEITQAIEAMAGNLEGFSGKNSIGLKAEFLSDYLEEGLDLFAEVLLEPAWNPKEVEKEKRMTLEAIKNQEDALSTLAFVHFQKTLFPHHPYGMRHLGTKKSVASLTAAKLARHCQKLLMAKNLVVSVVGDFEAQKILPLLDQKLKALPKKGTSFKRHKPDPKPSAVKTVEMHKEKEQAHLVLGFMASTMDSPDHAPMNVLTNILSGQGGRLFLELRDKLSLAYSVTAVLQEGVDPGYFGVYIGTEPSKVPTAVKGMLCELEKITTAPVAPEELERTKNYLVGTYELEIQKSGSLAQSFAFNELYGMGFREVYRYPDKILKVTRQDVLKVAKKYITPKAYVLSVVKPKN